MLTDAIRTPTRAGWQGCLLLASVGAALIGVCGIQCINTAHAAEPATAVAAGTVSVNQTIGATLVSHRGTTALYERGRGSGTPSCPITVQISIAGDTEATISFTCSASGGTISGRGITSYASAGPVARFSGTLRITHGSGRYAYASTTGLYITGTIKRHTYALSARVTGDMHV